MQVFKTYLFAVLIAGVFYSCGLPGGNDPGTEYMPDMAHSIAYEANLYDYYYYNTWDGEEAYYEYAKPRKPVANTIARGYFGIGAGDERRAAAMQGYEMNGSAPYAYSDTEPDRMKATREIITNPYPITTAGMARGKTLYEINCGICHGNKGDGEGWLVSEDNLNAVYPAQPAILVNDTFTLASNGRLYHAIMYGKNVMGGYGDKLSYEERWQVIHFIRSLQAKTYKKEYSETENTLNKGSLPYEDWKLAYSHSDVGHIGDGMRTDSKADAMKQDDSEIESADNDHEGGSHSHDHNDGGH